MSTWKIFSDNAGNYRWEPSPSHLRTTKPYSDNRLHLSPLRFSSFQDVLIQGFPIISEDCDKLNGEKTPVFQTATGNSVALKRSSVAKASSVLGDGYGDDDGNDNNHSGTPCFPGNEFVSPNSMFQTGSGKKVNISSEGYNRAKALLGVDESSDVSDIQSFASSPSSMFQTGSGKKVNVSSAGLNRAKALLGIDESGDVSDLQSFASSPNSMFQTGSGKKVNISSTGYSRAKALLNIDESSDVFNLQSFASSPSSMFQTGSGKKVNISSTGLNKAKVLLGMDESSDISNLQNLEPANKKSKGSDLYTFEEQSKEVGINSMVAEPHHLKSNLMGNEFHHEDMKFGQPDMFNSSSKPPAIKFNTAGGRSISVSSDALQRARSLLGDSEVGNILDDGSAGDTMFSFFKNDREPCNSDGKFFRRLNNTDSSQTCHQFERSEPNPKKFVSPIRSSFHRKHLEVKSETMLSGTNLLSRFDAEEHHSRSNGTHTLKRQSGDALADITNFIGIDPVNKKGTTTELIKLGRRTSVSPFKRPRSSKFTTPINTKLCSAPIEISSRESEGSHCKRRMSTHYPFQRSRTYIKDFFKEPPVHPEIMEELPVQIRFVKPDNSKEYIFSDGSQLIGVEAFYNMLVQSGASTQHASKEWVENHYKWIVWKLASYERCYSAKFMKEFLRVSNVLDELKYRYEREVNHGHRSAIRKILEGQASPCSPLVLCVSSILSDSETEIPTINGAGKSSNSKIELTDGWYSIVGQLDLLLSKHLTVGRLFVGQKLRISGASLNGWSGPVSPLEASPGITLLLHINGTHRAGWAERLGFCRDLGPPLAFRCVKSNGGPIPRTLVGVTRIYPVLYRERLKNGRSIVRSEKMEAALEQRYSQRCSNLVEGITSDFQRSTSTSVLNECDNEEGARIMKMLESAAEPELLMADMSSEQLASFSTYQAKIEASRQFDLQKRIEKALEDAGLTARDVTPFMRVRVVGLRSYGQYKGKDPREGLITIWNPTERQKHELVEGQAYLISGLVPSLSDVNMLYLQARGSSTKWKPLTTKEKEVFVPFFKPRKPVSLSGIGEIPLSSEFDTAVLVLHVGMEYNAGRQKRQWVFVADGSSCKLQREEMPISLLAISFCSPNTEDDSLSPINYNLVGSIVGFCNLVKRTKDDMNDMWVAEATENSAYYLSCDHSCCSHLKHAFALVQSWKQSSSRTIQKLKERILHIDGSHKG